MIVWLFLLLSLNSLMGSDATKVSLTGKCAYVREDLVLDMKDKRLFSVDGVDYLYKLERIERPVIWKLIGHTHTAASITYARIDSSGTNALITCGNEHAFAKTEKASELKLRNLTFSLGRDSAECKCHIYNKLVWGGPQSMSTATREVRDDEVVDLLFMKEDDGYYVFRDANVKVLVFDSLYDRLVQAQDDADRISAPVRSTRVRSTPAPKTVGTEPVAKAP